MSFMWLYANICLTWQSSRQMSR